MTIALVLGLASLATAAPSQASSPRSRSLAELVHRSERVVVGEIVRVHRIRVRASPDYCPGPAVQDVDVAEIDVERTVWGADDARHVFVVIPIGRREPLTGGPARSLWFLARSKPLQPADRDSRERSAGWAPVVRLADDDDGRVPLADATLGELSGWIQRIIESDAPYITAELETFGPCTFRVRIEPDASLFATECSAESARGRIAVSLEQILNACERERFWTLPCVVGHDHTRASDDRGCSMPPPSNGTRAASTRDVLRIRTARGDKTIVIGAPPDRRRDAKSEIDAYDRALRIWKTIPVARGWRLPSD
jgi:hypothetical protein